MTTIPAEVLTALAERRGVVARALYWFAGRDRETGDPVSLGLWNGDDAQVFTVGAETRTYFGPALVEFGRIVTQIGLNVPPIDLTLASLDPAVRQAVRAYDVRGATVEIHRALFSTATRNLIAPPDLRWRGHVDRLNFERSTVDDSGIVSASASLTLVPEIERLTEGLQAYRSHEDQQRAFPGDTGLIHAATAPLAEVVVGQAKVRVPGTGGGGGLGDGFLR
jgi:hypothetical protein